MIHPEVTILYKYRPFNAQSLSILINKRIWFSSPDTFNDPFDCGCRPTFDDLVSSIFESRGVIPTPEQYDQAVRQFEKDFSFHDIEKRLNSVGILSLSEDCHDIAMWSHYAEHHKGFCIGLERTANNSLGKNPTVRKVRYVEEDSTIQFSNPEKFIDEFYYRKSERHWKYENEWRCIVYPSATNDIVANKEWNIPGDIKKIIFGLNMLDVHKRTIINILGDEVDYYRVEKDKKYFKLNSFKLTKEEITLLQKG